MRLLSVNVSQAKEVPYQGKTVTTGIFKEPVGGRVMLRSLNLEGDGQADRNVHGGINKAVYAYPNEHYEYWSRELGRTDFTFGQFGENFTVSGMLEDAVRIGDVFRIGSALVEVTQPRAPCFKLGIRMGMESFPTTFMSSAPPEAPSPSMTITIGTLIRNRSRMFSAIAQAWPRSSAPIPG